MRLDQLEVFVALADERHFGRAADRLQISTSSFSKRLQDLEAAIGIQLFERTSRRVSLTPEAKPLLDQARIVLAEVETLESLSKDTAHGHVGTVKLIHSINHFDFVTSLVQTLRERAPALSLDYRQQPAHEIPAAVLAGDASIGLCWGPVPAGLSVHCFDVLELDTIFVPASHRLAGRASIDLADLDGETFILTGPDPAHLWRGSDIDIKVEHLPINGRDELATRVETGQGIVLTASRAVPRYRHRQIVAVPLADPATWGRLEQLLVWRADDSSPTVLNVVEIAKEVHTTVA